MHGLHAVIAAVVGHNTEHVIMIGNNEDVLVLHAVHLVIQMLLAVGRHVVVPAMGLGQELMFLAIQHKLKRAMSNLRASILQPPIMSQVVAALK